MLQLRKQPLLRCLEPAHIKQRPQLTDLSTNISSRQAKLWSLLALLLLMLLKAVVSLRLMETLQASDDPPMQVTIRLKLISVGRLVMSLLGSSAEKRKEKRKETKRKDYTLRRPCNEKPSGIMELPRCGSADMLRTRRDIFVVSRAAQCVASQRHSPLCVVQQMSFYYYYHYCCCHISVLQGHQLVPGWLTKPWPCTKQRTSSSSSRRLLPTHCKEGCLEVWPSCYQMVQVCLSHLPVHL